MHWFHFYILFAGETFVTRKVTRGVAKIHLGLMDTVSLYEAHTLFCSEEICQSY